MRAGQAGLRGADASAPGAEGAAVPGSPPPRLSPPGPGSCGAGWELCCPDRSRHRELEVRCLCTRSHLPLARMLMPFSSSLFGRPEETLPPEAV